MSDIAQKRERAEDARDILESKAFAAARADLRLRILNDLIATNDEEKTRDLVAQLKVVERISQELQLLINDYNSGVRALGRARPTHG
jgi:hypothetical protein